MRSNIHINKWIYKSISNNIARHTDTENKDVFNVLFNLWFSSFRCSDARARTDTDLGIVRFHFVRISRGEGDLILSLPVSASTYVWWCGSSKNAFRRNGHRKKENNNKSMECIIMRVFWRRPHQCTTRTNQMGSLMTIVMMTETTNDDRRASFFLAALVSDIKWQSLNEVSVCEASLLPAHLHRAIVRSTKWVWLSEWLSNITFIWIFLCFLWGLSSLIQPPYLFDSGGFALKMCPLYLNLLSGCTWTM